MRSVAVAGGLTALELAAGLPIGIDPDAPPLPGAGTAVDPLVALERAILPALERAPCVVTFSGGRDSSAVLAVAADVARRFGLPLPVPVTARFPRAPATDECQWQELVVHHLRLDTWLRPEFDGELDLVGPVAQRVLQRHGVLWPPNTHFHEPFLQMAAGGSLLTGIDGDGLLASWRWQRAADVLAGRAWPRPRDLVRVGLAVSPPLIRRLDEKRRPPLDLPWLRPAARAQLAALIARDRADEPPAWRDWVRWYAVRRSLRLTIDGLDRLAADHDVGVVHPLAAPEFLAALARAGGRTGLGDRAGVMDLLFGGLVPGEVVMRRSKASFSAAFFANHSLEFARRWAGDGVDAELVDVDALRAHWTQGAPWAMSSSLLQAAWLATESA